MPCIEILLSATQSEEDLVGRAEVRSTLFEIDVLDTELGMTGGELSAESSRGECLARP